MFGAPALMYGTPCINLLPARLPCEPLHHTQAKNSMKILVIAAGLLACQIAPAWSESEFQITCPGRATMTVSRASYGLSTLMWPKRHFQVAAGQQRFHLEGGDSVAVTRFRNGDRLVINKESGETFFVYAQSDKLVPCQRSVKRDAAIVSLDRYDDRQHASS